MSTENLYPDRAWELPIGERIRLAELRIKEVTIRADLQVDIDLGDLALDKMLIQEHSLEYDLINIYHVDCLSLGECFIDRGGDFLYGDNGFGNFVYDKYRPEPKYLSLSFLDSIQSIHALSLFGCRQVSSLYSVSRLKQLEILDLGNCSGVCDLSPISKLRHLTCLNLQGCYNISDLSPLVSLMQLTVLNLTFCTKIFSIESLGSLKCLKVLILANCVWVNDLEPIAKLSLLSFIDLWNCKDISDISPLKNITTITQLIISYCTKIVDLKPLQNLTALKVLDLAGCTGVTNLEPLYNLFEMTTLNLWGCTGVSDLKPLFNLKKLTSLYLSNCTEVTKAQLIGLAKAYERGLLGNLSTLSIDGIDSGLPEETIDSRDAVRIFRALLAQDNRQLNEVKLLLLGNGEVGKSHLLDRLSGEPFAFDATKKRTHNIDFRDWPAIGDDPHRRVLDFGGQAHLHGSHRFFLGSDHAVYVLVLDAARTAEENQLHYWLRFIAHHGKSPRPGEQAPVVIVVNKCDLVTLAESPDYRDSWSEANRIRENWSLLRNTLDELSKAGWHGAKVVGEPIVGMGIFDRASSKLKNDDWLKSLPFPCPITLHETISARNETALKEIQQRIREAITVAPNPSVGYGAPFHAFKEYIDSEFRRTDGPRTLSMKGSGWADIVEQLRIQETDVEDALPSLRSLGLIHWVDDFDDVARGDCKLVRKRLFNPRWVKDPLYELIQTPQGQHRRGIVDDRTIRERLNAWDESEIDLVLELMHACKIAFKVRRAADREYSGDRLIPDLLEYLPDNAPAPNPDTLLWRLERPFLSDRVLLRFIGEHYVDVRLPEKNCWRNRIEFPWPTAPDCTVAVSSELNGTLTDPPSLRIEVRGGSVHARELVARTVKDELAGILVGEKLMREEEKKTWTHRDERSRPSEDDWLDHQVRSAPANDWIAEKDAIDLHSKQTGKKKKKSTSPATTTIDPETFARYRRDGITHTNKTCGCDKNGYIWRKQGKTITYRESRILSPVTFQESVTKKPDDQTESARIP